MRGKVILFGAGATGRGHVGLLAYQAGYELVFVDKNPVLVEQLQSARRYTVRLYRGHGESFQEEHVTGYRTYLATERATVAEEIVDADLVLTAVFDQNLPDVAETIALAAQACLKVGRTRPVNFIACENMMDSSSTLGRQVMELLDSETRRYAEEYFGFPDCMISRVVPRPEPDPLFIITEDYNEWTARLEAFKGAPLAGLNALELVSDCDLVGNQTARLERKLFIHNGGHAICGYVGYQRGHRYIHEAVADPVVAAHVGGALDELGEVVRRKHGFPAESIESYKADLVRRGSIAEMRDEIRRVVRDPIRKLSNRERLVAPALLAVEYGLPRGWIVRGIVAALKYGAGMTELLSDPQALQLGKMLGDRNETGKLTAYPTALAGVLKKVCGIPSDSPLITEIQATWEGWSL